MASHSAPAPGAAVSGTSPLNSTLDDVTALVIHSMNVTALAERMGVPRRRLYMWGTPASNPSDEHRDLPAKVIAPLTLATCRYDIVEHLAAQVGGVFALRPDGGSAAGPLLSHVSALTSEYADVQREVARMLADGVTETEEARATLAELDQLEAQIVSLRLRLTAAVQVARKPLAKAGAR
jgi:hypothetical protein